MENETIKISDNVCVSHNSNTVYGTHCSEIISIQIHHLKLRDYTTKMFIVIRGISVSNIASTMTIDEIKFLIIHILLNSYYIIFIYTQLRFTIHKLSRARQIMLWTQVHDHNLNTLYSQF